MNVPQVPGEPTELAMYRTKYEIMQALAAQKIWECAACGSTSLPPDGVRPSFVNDTHGHSVRNPVFGYVLCPACASGPSQHETIWANFIGCKYPASVPPVRWGIRETSWC